MTIPSQLLWMTVPFFVNGLAIVVLVKIWAWRNTGRGERVPVSEKLLRPAGESLRRKIEKSQDDLVTRLAVVVIAPVGAGCAVVWVSLKALSLPVLVSVSLAMLAWIVVFAVAAIWLVELVRELRDSNLGFHGERAVGEELNQLLSDGCRVFHDVPMPPYGNIDHVIVAPSGVYAVETKTRRKRNAPPGSRQKEHEVIFDGKSLQFPFGTDTTYLEQARQQADRLRIFLSKAIGEPVQTTPILTLPGWYVINRVNAGAIKVLNPKKVREAVAADGQKGRSLAPQIMVRIAHQLDQKCRDVEL